MKTLQELHLNRCNVQVEDDVKDWYMYKARSMGMSMSQLMAFVLSNWYEQHINADAVRMIADLNKNGELQETNRNVLELLTEFQQMELEETQPKNSKIGKKEGKK